jgi:hypothetical protein
MRRTFVGMLGVTLALAGCNGLVPTQKASGDLTIKEAAAKTRAMSVVVIAPNALANLNGKIQSDAIASVVAAGGGNVVAAGGGNVVAAGGGNVVAAGGGNVIAAGGANFAGPTFRIQAAVTNYTPVIKAFVYLEDALTGKGIGDGYATDETGTIQLKGIPDGKAISAIARYKLGDKEYRQAVPIAFGSADKPVYADPINTVVEGRVRQILRENGKASALSFEMLKKVWDVFNEADVDVDVSALENGKSLDALFTFYQDLVTQLGGKDADGNEKDPGGKKAQVVKDYMATLKGPAK